MTLLKKNVNKRTNVNAKGENKKHVETTMIDSF